MNKVIIMSISIEEEARKQFPHIKNRSLDQYCKREGFRFGAEWMKEKAIDAFKANCQYPKDAEGCECKLCVRCVGGHCALLDGFIEKLNL